MAVLHFLRDLLAYGGDSAPSSSFNSGPQSNSPEMQARVKQLLAVHGEELVQRIMTGMMYSFPGECFPDASGVMLAMFQLEPVQTAERVQTTVAMLPSGSVSVQEQERLLNNIKQYVENLSFSSLLPTLVLTHASLQTHRVRRGPQDPDAPARLHKQLPQAQRGAARGAREAGGDKVQVCWVKGLCL